MLHHASLSLPQKVFKCPSHILVLYAVPYKLFVVWFYLNKIYFLAYIIKNEALHNFITLQMSSDNIE